MQHMHCWVRLQVCLGLRISGSGRKMGGNRRPGRRFTCMSQGAEKGQRRGCKRMRQKRESGCEVREWIGGENGHEREADAKEREEGASGVCASKSGQVPAIFWPSPALFCSCPFRRLRCAGAAAVAQPMTGKKRAIRGVDLLQGKSDDRGWDEERCEEQSVWQARWRAQREVLTRNSCSIGLPR